MEREEIYRITNSGKVIPNGELIRCKDCAYLIHNPGFMNDGYCRYFRDKCGAKVKPDNDFYCGAGERKHGP